MTRRFGFTVGSLAGLVGIAAITSSMSLAQSTDTRTKPATAKPPVAKDTTTPPKMELPPGMTEAEAKAFMEASMPGPMHAFLAESIGTWKGKTTHWMSPDAPPATSDCTAKISPLIEGLFTKMDLSGDIPGMGPMHGFGTQGFDNVSQKFQSTWCDNMSTGMMVGTGELSSDRKVLNWTYTFNCPITKKATVMREVDTRLSKDSMKLEMFGPDVKTGKEFKMMEVTFTRVPNATATGSEK